MLDRRPGNVGLWLLSLVVLVGCNSAVQDESAGPKANQQAAAEVPNGGTASESADANDAALVHHAKASGNRFKKNYEDYKMGEKVVRSEADWKEILTPLQFEVTRQKGTERAGTGAYAYNKDEGVYCCVCCGLPLFSSENKFESGTGWPSYDAPIKPAHVAEKSDRKFFMVRTEVLCQRCDAHLGHVFTDGPQETTGLRYCINSAALEFLPADAKAKDNSEAQPTAE